MERAPISFGESQLKLHSNPPRSNENWRKHPIAAGCMALVVLNWLLFMGMSIYFGGFADGMRPSVDGFVLENKGHRTPVSPSVWLFSLIYGGVTLTLTPPIAIVLVRARIKHLWAEDPVLKWAVVCIFLMWLIGWESGVVGGFVASLRDSSKLH
jgi:hypothetical protein